MKTSIALRVAYWICGNNHLCVRICSCHCPSSERLSAHLPAVPHSILRKISGRLDPYNLDKSLFCLQNSPHPALSGTMCHPFGPTK